MNKDFPRYFAEAFAALNKDNLASMADFYHADLHFTDPLHEVVGLDAMTHYCAQLYENVTSIHFDFQQIDEIAEGEAVLRWVMTYQHPRLQSGKPIAVPGCSFIAYRDDKVYRHRDYYDAGALLYEHIPLFGSLIQWLKRRLA